MGRHAARNALKKKRAFELFPDLNYDHGSDDYFTQADIAERLGISSNTINNWYKEWKCLAA